LRFPLTEKPEVFPKMLGKTQERFSIASIGTGVGGFPPEKAAKIMLDVVKEHLKGETCLETVIFALYTKNVYEAFEKVLG